VPWFPPVRWLGGIGALVLLSRPVRCRHVFGLSGKVKDNIWCIGDDKDVLYVVRWGVHWASAGGVDDSSIA
jgi:hypothetical protein